MQAQRQRAVRPAHALQTVFPRKANRRAALGAILLVLLTSPPANCTADADRCGPVKIGGENKGVHLEYTHIASRMLPDVANRLLWLVHNSKITRLSHFKQLTGYFQITNAFEALKFVRFRSSLWTFYYWRDEIGLEVMQETDVARQPTFGLNKFYPPLGLRDSGYAGVLSSSAYKQGGFQPPVVTSSNRGFTVVRWIFTGREVLKVKEYVGRNGEYDCVVLERNAPPKLADTVWWLPLFK